MAAYEVWLKGFAANADDPIPELMRMFSLTEARAKKLAGAVPVAVKKGATRETAEKFVQRLEAIGAQVEIRSAGGMAEQLPQRPRSSRSVAPSRSRTGRGLGPPGPPDGDSEPGALPRRRTSSSSMEAISARPPGPRRRHSQGAMPAADDGQLQRRGRSTAPAASGVVSEALQDDDDGIAVSFGEDSSPRRQQATAALGSAVASRPPQRAAVVGQMRSTPPPAAEQPRRRRNTGELPKAGPAPMSGAPPAASRPPPAAIPPAPRPMSPISAAPPAMASVPPPAATSVAPPPLASAPPPPLGIETTMAPPTGSDYVPAALTALGGVLIIIWRVVVEASVFQGQADWLVGVWLEAAALAAILAGGLRLLAVRDGRVGQSFLGSNARYVAAMLPLAALVNWGISSTQSRSLEGSLDARIEVQNKVADACERTAKDEASCDECCEGDMVFGDVCECIVPFHCIDGDANAKACKECCLKLSDDIPRYRFVHNQGCVCNADDSFFN